MVVDDRGLHLKALDAEETPPQLGATRDAIFQEVGTIQLPELMLAVDHATVSVGASWGGPATTERELLLVYAALLAHGTELNAASVALMIPGLAPEAIAEGHAAARRGRPHARSQRPGRAVSASS